MSYCSNLLVVTGRDDDVEHFTDSAAPGRARRLVLEAPDPVPADYVTMRLERDWKEHFWGTGSYQGVTVVEPEYAGIRRYQFDTAGNPPRGWVERVSAKYPTLGFALHWVVAAEDRAGSEVCVAGKVVAAMEGMDRLMARNYGAVFFDWDTEEDELEEEEDYDDEQAAGAAESLGRPSE